MALRRIVDLLEADRDMFDVWTCNRYPSARSALQTKGKGVLVRITSGTKYKQSKRLKICFFRESFTPPPVFFLPSVPPSSRGEWNRLWESAAKQGSGAETLSKYASLRARSVLDDDANWERPMPNDSSRFVHEKKHPGEETAGCVDMGV